MLRKQHDSSEQPERFDVYITSDYHIPPLGGTMRFFFTEELTSAGALALQELLTPQFALLDGFSLRPYAHYVALTWVKRANDLRHLDIVEPEIRLTMIGALANHFDWQDPKVKIFNDNERRVVMEQLGVDWTLGES